MPYNQIPPPVRITGLLKKLMSTMGKEKSQLFVKPLHLVPVGIFSGRNVDYNVLEFHYAYELSDDEMGVLLRIVEAEAGNEDEEGKLLVANVVLNRQFQLQTLHRLRIQPGRIHPSDTQKTGQKHRTPKHQKTNRFSIHILS